MFEKYHEYADASVGLALKRKEEELRISLGNGLPQGALEKAVRRLLSTEEARLKEQLQSLESGCMLKIRLNNENFRFLYPDDQDGDTYHFPEDAYYKNAGQYIKAVLEEYASKSFYDREEIFYRETLDLLRHGAETGTLARLNFLNGAFDMKIYGVFPDADHEYHYVTGLSCPAGNPGEGEHFTSVRLSQILSAKTRSYRSGRLTAEQKKQIQQMIKNSGVAFLRQSEPEEIVVRMTKEGIRKYRKMLHLRPLLVKKEDYEEYSIYHFHCTQLQARFYLFRLGGDTYVLKPESLRLALQERFNAAAAMYNRNPEDFQL